MQIITSVTSKLALHIHVTFLFLFSIFSVLYSDFSDLKKQYFYAVVRFMDLEILKIKIKFKFRSITFLS